MPDPSPGLDPTALAAVFRAEQGRVVATLTRYLGSLGLAEDAAQEAYVVALEAWSETGLPPNPGGWLVTTARRKAIDRLRRESVRDAKHEQAQMLNADQGIDDPDPPSGVVDDRLRMIFTCCHPALDPAPQVALTLKVLGGLSTAEVAAAFLVEEAAMAKRLTRTWQKIAAARIPYRVPPDAELPGRVRGVLATVYLMYNEGYLPGGEAPAGSRPELTAEAIRLARLVVDLMPDEPEAVGLLALMLLTEARSAARVVDGRLVPLGEQDRSGRAAPPDRRRRGRGRRVRPGVGPGRQPGRAALPGGAPGRPEPLTAHSASPGAGRSSTERLAATTRPPSSTGTAAKAKATGTECCSTSPRRAMDTGASTARGKPSSALVRPSSSRGVLVCTNVGRATSVL